MLADEVDTTEEWGYKLNLLAVNRRSKIVMETIVPDEGKVFISLDIGGAEPTILLNYCDDPTLYDILFTYRKKPAEVIDGVLMTNNMYITACSKTSFMQNAMREIAAQEGISFVDLVNKDMDKAKELLGFKYDFSKRVSLAMIYGLSAWGVERQHNEAGFPVKKGYGEGFYNSFWEVLPAAYSFLQAQIKIFEKAFKRKAPVCNLFGTPLPSGKPKDAGNRIIQSSVSSFIRMVCHALFVTHPFAHFIRLVCIIHDELILEVKKEHVEELRAHMKMCVDMVNEIVGFSYPLKLGFKEVSNFYAK